MSWYYKIIKHDAAEEGEHYSEDWFGIHEFYESLTTDGGSEPAWTENPVTVTGETAQDCIDQLNMMLADCVRQLEGEKILESLQDGKVHPKGRPVKRPWWRQLWGMVSKDGGTGLPNCKPKSPLPKPKTQNPKGHWPLEH